MPDCTLLWRPVELFNNAKEMMPDCTLLWRQVELFNNAVDQCVRTKHDDQLRYAGVGKNLKTDRNWGRFCLASINSTTPVPTASAAIAGVTRTGTNSCAGRTPATRRDQLLICF